MIFSTNGKKLNWSDNNEYNSSGKKFNKAYSAYLCDRSFCGYDICSYGMASHSYGLIYLAASMLPTPYAMAAGAIGAGLADGLSGFVVWLPGTIVIKAITALCFSRKTEKIICVRNLLGIIPALVICVVCYSLYEGIFMAGGFSKSAIISAFGQTPAYCIQVLASSILYIVLGLGFDKAGLKKKFSHLFG